MLKNAHPTNPKPTQYTFTHPITKQLRERHGEYINNKDKHVEKVHLYFKLHKKGAHART